MNYNDMIMIDRYGYGQLRHHKWHRAPPLGALDCHLLKTEARWPCWVTVRSRGIPQGRKLSSEIREHQFLIVSHIWTMRSGDDADAGPLLVSANDHWLKAINLGLKCTHLWYTASWYILVSRFSMSCSWPCMNLFGEESTRDDAWGCADPFQHMNHIVAFNMTSITSNWLVKIYLMYVLDHMLILEHSPVVGRSVQHSWNPYLFAGLEHFLFFHILGMSSSQLISCRGVQTTNQIYFMYFHRLSIY